LAIQSYRKAQTLNPRKDKRQKERWDDINKKLKKLLKKVREVKRHEPKIIHELEH